MHNLRAGFYQSAGNSQHLATTASSLNRHQSVLQLCNTAGCIAKPPVHANLAEKQPKNKVTIALFPGCLDAITNTAT